MGAPSVAHEERVEDLLTLAVLGGYTVPMNLGWGLRPDVLRACSTSGAMFLGDAKATESAGNTATERRLRWFWRAIASARTGTPVVVALAVPGDASVSGYRMLLRRAAGPVLTGDMPTTTRFDDTVVVAVRAHVP